MLILIKCIFMEEIMKNKALALTGLTILLASTLVACSSGSDTSKKSEKPMMSVQRQLKSLQKRLIQQKKKLLLKFQLMIIMNGFLRMMFFMLVWKHIS